MSLADLRTRGEWGIEDCSDPKCCVAMVVVGNVRTANREALALHKRTNAPVIIYAIDGGVWEPYGGVKP